MNSYPMTIKTEFAKDFIRLDFVDSYEQEIVARLRLARLAGKSRKEIIALWEEVFDEGPL